MPATGTLEDLGRMVQQKYPAYSALDPAEVGRRVQAKYPGAYSGYSASAASASSPDDPGAPDAPQPQAQPQPQLQPSSLPGPGAGSPSASGFGTSLPAPPIIDQGLFMPSEARRRSNETFDTQQKNAQAISLAQAQRSAQAGMTEDVERFKRSQRTQTLKDLESQGITLTPRMKAEILSGMPIAPERPMVSIPGTHSGDQVTQDIDATGQAVDHSPTASYRYEVNPENGQILAFPVISSGTSKVMPDSKSSTGWSLVFYNRAGNELKRDAGAAPPAAFVPQTSTSSGTAMVTQQIEDPVTHRLVTVQVPTPRSNTTVRSRALPGQTQTPSAPAALTPPPGAVAPGPAAPSPTASPASPTAAPTAPTGLPRGSRTLGNSPAQQKEDIQNPLSSNAQTIVLKTAPQLATLKRLETALEPYKSSTAPMTTFLPRLAYSMGFSNSQEGVDQMLSNLEMTGITSAASALGGSTRAAQFVAGARLHTADAWKDSGKLQYDKVKQIEQRLRDIVNVAKGPEGQRYPGLTPPPNVGHEDPAGIRHLVK